MKIYYSDHYDLPLPKEHRFPMQKYGLVRKSLLERRIVEADELYPAPLCSKEDILRVHTEDYYLAIQNGTLDPKEQRLIGFPWSPIMIKRSRASVGGYLAAVNTSLKDGIAGNLSGGTHHSFPDRGEGFCVFNDFAIASKKLIDERGFKNILILDLDVHQGNGNAFILTPIKETYVVSFHGMNNYPFRKERSDLDIELPDGATDDIFLSQLKVTLKELQIMRPWDIILYQAGVDGLKEDKLGKLSLSHQGMHERDRLVFQFARDNGTPLAVALGGGYSDPITSTVEAHLNTYRAIKEIYS